MLLMPLVTIVVASALTGEAITPPFVAGGALVLAGVYVGAIRRHHDPGPAPRVAASNRPLSAQTGCA